MRSDMKTLKNQISASGGTVSTCLPEVSLVNRSRSQENAKEPGTTATCGPRCSVSFGLFARDGSLGKTFTASPLREFIGNKRRAVLLDNNVLASDFGLEQIEEIVRMGIAVDFNQGLDARKACNDAYILDLLARVKWISQIRFACDRMSQLESVVKCVEELGYRGIKPYKIFVYCLIQDVGDALERINALRKLGVIPFAQPYRDFDNNIEPTKEQKRLARWCNHKAIFKSVEFKNYKG